MKITVFTPTFNRAYILPQLYQSLMRQSFRDFEWLIVDDGSSDDTESVVSRWSKANNGFPIRYFKQPNGGKCRAINRGLELASGLLFFVVDSDDYLTSDALQKISEWEANLPHDARYCGVAGNLGISENETPNKLFEEEFYDGTLLDRYTQVDGERAMAFYTDIHRKYPYPSFENESFMTEAVAYNRMAHDGYRMRFYNDILCIYEYRDDGLTKAGNTLFLKNPRGYALWIKEKVEFTGGNWKEKIRLWYSYYCDMHHCDKRYRLKYWQCADYIGAPRFFMLVLSAVHSLLSALRFLSGKSK